MRDPFTTWMISATTAAPPERVWQCLTCGSANAGVPRGLNLTSTWRPGDAVRLEPGAEPGTTTPIVRSDGEVLAATPPVRLSYTLGARAGGADPTVIVTWDIAADAGGSTVALTIDDLAPCGPDDHELRDAWEQVVASLVRALDMRSRTEGTATEF